MATSGSTNFSVNRNEMISASLRVLGVLGVGETASADEVTDASQALNMMLKAWQTRGMQAFLRKPATLFLQKDTHQYSLGSTGDHATTSYTSTTLTANAASSATTLTVSSTTGMAAGYYIGIVLTSGSFHWTTIQSVTNSTTVVITSGLASAAASGNKVVFYQTKIPRPLRIIQAYVRDTNNVDLPVREVESYDYFLTYQKNVDGITTAFYYDPQTINGQLYVKYEETNVNKTFEFIYHRMIEDMDNSTDDFDTPIEISEAIKFNLALRLAPEYGRVVSKELAGLAAMSEQSVFYYMDSPRKVIPTRF